MHWWHTWVPLVVFVWVVCCFSCVVFQRRLSQAYGRWDTTQQLCLNNRLDEAANAATQQTLIHTHPHPSSSSSVSLTAFSLRGSTTKLQHPKHLAGCCWQIQTAAETPFVCVWCVTNSVGRGYDSVHIYTFKMNWIVCQDSVCVGIRVICVFDRTGDILILLDVWFLSQIYNNIFEADRRWMLWSYWATKRLW